MIVEGKDPFLLEKLQEELNAEVNATLRLILSELERLASLEPIDANEPVSFNRSRHLVIRKVWALAKECIKYGARSVQ